MYIWEQKYEKLWRICGFTFFLFLYLSSERITKSAQKQIDAHKKIDQDETYIPAEEGEHPVNRPLTWEDLFPSEPKQQVPVRPVVVKAEKEEKKIKLTNIESPSQPEVTKKVSEIVKRKLLFRMKFMIFRIIRICYLMVRMSFVKR